MLPICSQKFHIFSLRIINELSVISNWITSLKCNGKKIGETGKTSKPVKEVPSVTLVIKTRVQSLHYKTKLAIKLLNGFPCIKTECEGEGERGRKYAKQHMYVNLH